MSYPRGIVRLQVQADPGGGSRAAKTGGQLGGGKHCIAFIGCWLKRRCFMLGLGLALM
jgi:hypothetical protein